MSGLLATRRGVMAKPTALPVPSGPPTLVGTAGTAVYSAASVVDPTTLTPDTGSGYNAGDLILCYTLCWGKTGAVATPTGWTLLCDGSGTAAFHLVLFGKVAASTTEPAPSVVWTSLTTGAAGWPCAAQCQAFRGCAVGNMATLVDATSVTGNTGSSTTVANGGNQFTTVADNDLIIKMCCRGNATVDTWAASGYTNVTGGAGAGASMHTTSGNDMAGQWAYKVKTPAALEAVANFATSGNVTTGSSAGIMVALKAQP